MMNKSRELMPPPNVKRKLPVLMARRGNGTKGQKIKLQTNHYKVDMKNIDIHFYHYSVALYYEDGTPVDAKGIGRIVLKKTQDTYSHQLGGKQFAYDGEKSLFTVGPLPGQKLNFIIVVEESTSTRTRRNDGSDSPPGKKPKHAPRTKTYKVEFSFAAKIPMQAIWNAIRGQESDNSQEVIRVLDIILRQYAANKGDYLLVRQSYFDKNDPDMTRIGEGILCCRGIHSSFRTTQGGLSLNIDVSTTTVVRTGPVLDFLLANQNVKDSDKINWDKAKRTLKNLRVKTFSSNQEYKITGLSEKICKDQTFSWRQRDKDKDGEYQTTEVTVYDYFLQQYHDRDITLRRSANLPCINVGKPNRPTFIPIELCCLVTQRYTKALSTSQRSSLVGMSRQKPHERKTALDNAYKYNDEPLLQSCGVSINKELTCVDGRILTPPKLMFGEGQELIPRNGRWYLNHKKLVQPAKVEEWAVVNFCPPGSCPVGHIINEFMRCGKMKGMVIDDPHNTFEEIQQYRREPPLVRVGKMFEVIQKKLPGRPKFILCLLPEKKNCEIYGPWKKLCLATYGIVTQCMAPEKGRFNDMYLSNLLLKVNAKLGGLNSMLVDEHIHRLPRVSKVPTMILGMDVSHGSPGQSDIPSVAAVVGSTGWPLISRYRASVRTQSPKLEMIDSLFKPVSDTEDNGIMRELLLDYYASSKQRKPEQIIIFRDGVSESQFTQVLNKELGQIIEACEFYEENWRPKFVFIVAQKNHHTRFFQEKSHNNVLAGTIIDSQICHPRNNDFYLCAHAGMIGTSRPTHYHVLFDEVGFSADELQQLVHSLSYVSQRSTTAISIVAPISYAHLAATQLSTWLKFENMSETSSSKGEASSSKGETSSSNFPVPQLSKLHDNVSSSMFFC